MKFYCKTFLWTISCVDKLQRNAWLKKRNILTLHLCQHKTSKYYGLMYIITIKPQIKDWKMYFHTINSCLYLKNAGDSPSLCQFFFWGHIVCVSGWWSSWQVTHCDLFPLYSNEMKLFVKLEHRGLNFSVRLQVQTAIWVLIVLFWHQIVLTSACIRSLSYKQEVLAACVRN